MRSEPIGNVRDEFGGFEVVGSLIEAETLKDSDGNEECEDSEDEVKQ